MSRCGHRRRQRDVAFDGERLGATASGSNRSFEGEVADLDAELRRRASVDDTARRLATIPGVGPITAAAITTFAPPMETFSKGRNFAAWVGLTPRQYSSGGKERKPKMLVAVALANRMARTAWAFAIGLEPMAPQWLTAQGRGLQRSGDGDRIGQDRRCVAVDVSRTRERKGKRSRDRIGRTIVPDDAPLSAGK
ncbi:transposase [Phaeovulum sp.]|uniref:transposase n=1 Tax=Phaeovulum sp. TaxID=2934796 RepID=UPI0039E70479